MSLINDALKQARKGPPEKTPPPPQQLQPAADEPSGVPGWLLPSVVILLVVAAIFFIGWAVVHHSGQSSVVPVSNSAPAPVPVAVAPAPAGPVNPPVVSVPTPPVPMAQAPATNPPVALPPPFVLKLQGIDYSPTAPSAILNGKTVHPGDTFHSYRVKAISNNSVTLIGPDNQEKVVEMEN